MSSDILDNLGQVLQGIGQNKKPKFLDPAFPKQNEFIEDGSPFIDVLCTRRAGKSYGIGLRLIKDAFEHDGVSVLYVGLTRDSSKRIMFKDILKVINTKLQLEMRFNEVELSARLPNGSCIYLVGADAKPDEMEKILGQKYKAVVIDEAGSFRQDINRLVYEILTPSVADYNGSIILSGTPTVLLNTLFHKVSTGQTKGWSHHEWDTIDNPYMRVKWLKQIEVMIEQNPLVVKTPAFRRMFKKEWVIDTEALCYKFIPELNSAAALPQGEKFYYLLGVDLGYEDASSFSICCYSEHDPNFYVVESYKKKHMTISAVAEQIKHYMSQYDLGKIVIDNANKQAVEEIKQRYGIPLTAADKSGKSDFIEIMNSDFITGKIKLLTGKNAALEEEYLSLVWDERSEKRVENSACENHLCDATLYAWRYNYAYCSRPKTKAIGRNTDAYMDNFWEEEARRVEEKKMEEKEIFNNENEYY